MGAETPGCRDAVDSGDGGSLRAHEHASGITNNRERSFTVYTECRNEFEWTKPLRCGGLGEFVQSGGSALATVDRA